MIIRFWGCWPFKITHTGKTFWHPCERFYRADDDGLKEFKVTWLRMMLRGGFYLPDEFGRFSSWVLWIFTRGGYSWGLVLTIDRQRL